MEDPYKTLGVARDASPDQIRQAYRQAAKKHHPDLNPGNLLAEERFKAASAANALLSDPEQRARFDRGEIDGAGTEAGAGSTGEDATRQRTYRDYAEGEAGRRYGAQGPGAADWSAEDLGSIFGSIFSGPDFTADGFKTAGPGRAGAGRGDDVHYHFAAEFLDAVNGATRRLSLPDGRTLDVKIPPGTSDGQVLRLRGQGNPGRPGGAHGDALVEVQVKPHDLFTRTGQDIEIELPVSLSEAVLGGSVDVPTPGGPVRMKIPAGSDTGTRLRLRGRGVPTHGTEGVGELYANLRVVLGKPDAALEAFLRSWKPEHPDDPRRAMESHP